MRFSFRLLTFALGAAVMLGALPAATVTAANDDYLESLPPLIDRELFFGDPEISGSQLSPDGEYISFIKAYNGVRNVYVKKRVDSFDKAKPVTADERPVLGYFWSRDSKYILYVQDKLGNENWHVYAVDPSADPDSDTGVPPARDLTPIEGITARIYAVPRNTPGQFIVGMNDRDETYHDVYRVDIATGERELLIENTFNVGGFFYDLEGNVRLAIRQMDDGGLEILRVEGDELTQIYTCTWEETAYPIRFHKDGKRAYMQTNEGPEVDLTRLVLLDPMTGEIELVESDPEGEVDFGGAVFSNATDELIATAYVGDKTRVYPKNEQVEKDLKFFEDNLPEGEYNIQSSTQDMRYHIVSVSRDVDPGSVYLYDREKSKIELLYKSRPELPSKHLAEVKPIRYKSRDGLEIPAYLTLPRGVEHENLPLLVVPHGGPWSRDYWGYDPYAQFMANRGYVVFQMNFRGSTGYGKKFLNAGNKEWGFGYMQHDITDGVKYLIEQGIADPDRVGIFGGSYGGYATLAGVTFTPDLYAAAVPYVAPSNLVTLIESFPAYWGPFIKRWYLRVGDPKDEADKKDLIARSPLFLADKIKTPMLVVHGLNDPRVKKSESDQLVVALRERGVNVEYIVAPDEGHGFRAPDNRLALAVAAEKFLAKHLGGRYQEDVPQETAGKLAEITVDINTVELADTMLDSYAETAPLPEFDTSLVTKMRMEYDSEVEMQGQAMTMSVAREVIEGEINGSAAWMIITATDSDMGAAADTFYVDKETLAPITRRIARGQMKVFGDYTDDAIVGTIVMGSNEMPIDVSLSAPVAPDGPALEVALATLPLAEGYETTLRLFDVMSMKVRNWSLKVDGTEKTEVPAGSFDAYKLTLAPLDGGVDTTTMYVSKDIPRCLLSRSGKLPATAGGGNASMTITKMEQVQ
jgi:dipeptidyl aminopeptidase/acylaminoacyl peptidase